MTKRPRTPAAEEAVALLRSIAAFGALDDESLDALARDAVTRRLARGAILQLRGDTVEGVALVAKGFLRVSMSSPQGKRHITSYLGPGQMFNLLAVIDGGPAIHDLDAATDVEMVLLPREGFLRLHHARPAVAAAVQQLLNTRLRLVFDGLTDAILLTLRQRCARALLHAMDAVGEHVDDGTVTMHLTQGEVADMLGNARPVVNRVLVEFQRGGIIELGYQRIVVLKPDALRAAAQG